VTITSTAAVAGTYRATAAVQATEPDPVAGNNGAAAAVTVK